MRVCVAWFRFCNIINNKMVIVLCAQMTFFPCTHLLHVFGQRHRDNFSTIQVILTSNCVTLFGS